MGSRIRVNPDHLFELFCEVVSPSSNNEDPWILQKFPETFDSEDLLKPLPQFAHPCKVPLTGVQHFSFVLTNLDSQWTYGFCRHAPDSETSLCILSFLPWHEIFYKILNYVAELACESEQGELWQFLEALYNSPIPTPHSQLKISFNNKAFSCVCPDYNKLPRIPENRNLTEYFNAIDANNMMIIFASMLYERRILITSNKMNRLSACVQAANALIYPMLWQHIFIPVLPNHLIDYLCAPMPFLIGVPSQILSKVQKCELGEVVILDADENKVESPFNDLQSMPSDITSSLKKKLKNPNNMLGEGVAHAFLRALVHLIGGYRDALKLKSGEQITFSDEAFIQSRPQSIQPFLEKMLQLQIFRQFIDERLEKLNSGNGFSDEFEYEVNRYSDRNSIKLKTQYREWTTNMKKEGGAFLKTVKNRTNPAVKHAYKSVKDKSKQAYKGFRTKINDMQVKPQGAIYYQNTDNLNEWQPRSAPASPTSPRSRPRTIHGQKVFKEDAFSTHKNNNNHSNNHYSMYVDQESYIKNGTESESDDRLEDEDVGANTDDTGEYDDTTPEYEALNMDLMGDLQDIIFRKCSISDSSPLEEQRPMIGSSSLQSLPEFSSNFGKCQQKSSENTISLIKLDSLVEDEDDFDPLKAGGVSPAFPNNDSFTLDIFKELQNTPSSQNTNFSNPFHSATQSGLSSLHTTKTNPFSSNFNSNAISSTSEQPNVQAKDTKKTLDAPLRQPLSVNDKSQSKPADPFADLVKWDKLSQNTSTNVKANWTSFK